MQSRTSPGSRVVGAAWHPRHTVPISEAVGSGAASGQSHTCALGVRVYTPALGVRVYTPATWNLTRRGPSREEGSPTGVTVFYESASSYELLGCPSVAEGGVCPVFQLYSCRPHSGQVGSIAWPLGIPSSSFCYLLLAHVLPCLALWPFVGPSHPACTAS